MSTPTHILAGTEPVDEKHSNHAYRHTHIYTHTHTHTNTHWCIHNLIRSSAGPGLCFYLAGPNCTFELKCVCCIVGCCSKDWFAFVICLSGAFKFCISVISQTGPSTGSPRSLRVHNQRLHNFIKAPEAESKPIQLPSGKHSVVISVRVIFYSGLWGRVFGPGGEAVMSSGRLEVSGQTGQTSENKV